MVVGREGEDEIEEMGVSGFDAGKEDVMIVTMNVRQ